MREDTMPPVPLEIRSALRLFSRRPVLAVTASLTLAVGIALNTAAYSVVNALWFRPLPFTDDTNLVVLTSRQEKPGGTPLLFVYSGYDVLLPLNPAAAEFRIPGHEPRMERPSHPLP
jgi:hypothetical protein